MKKIRNKPASILARLKNVAQANDIDYNAILILYMQERFLYRLAVSPYADNFVLKGGLLLFSIDHFNTRPTLDIDFLAINIPNRVDFIKQVISTIANITCDDGLIFRANDISLNVMEHDIYEGIKVGITCILGTARNRLHIDIGFGDVIVPKPADIYYPVLLDTKPPPLIKGYSLESVIAEKFETMLKLSIINVGVPSLVDSGWMLIFFTSVS
jgi:hypothetical protein